VVSLTHTALMVERMATTELARRDLLEFIGYTKADYQAARHHVLLCELAQRLVYGRNQRIIINLPPRHGKSEIFSIRLPAFYLGAHPEKQIIHTSYALSLSNEFSRQVRSLIRDDYRYRRLFPKTMLDPERQRIDDWKTTAGGGWLGRGVEGGISGHGGDLILGDDLHKEGDERSPDTLRATAEWYASALRTRLMPGGNIGIIHTRWHTRDMTGSLLAKELENEFADKWEIFTLPAIAGENDALGRAPGEPLWAERYDLAALKAIESNSDYYWQALYQQQPLNEIGALFERQDFRRYNDDQETVIGRAAWCFDLALSEKESADYSAVGRWMYDKASGNLFVSQIHRLHESFPQVKAKIHQWMDIYKDDDFCFPAHMLELVAMQELKHERPHDAHRIKTVEQKGDKHERAAVLASRVRNGQVFVEWTVTGDKFINEHVNFPDQFDDMVDMSSVASHHFGLKQEYLALIGYSKDEQLQRELIARTKRNTEAANLLRRVGNG
jgi:hypothetical protein